MNEKDQTKGKPYPDFKDDSKYDYDFKDIQIISSAIKKKMHANFYDESFLDRLSNQVVSKIFYNKEYKFIGKVKYEDYSHYDYENQKSLLGFGKKL